MTRYLTWFALAAIGTGWFIADGFEFATHVDAAPASVDDRVVDYANDIQPILSNSCYACHGPDTGSREADLRLDLRDAALGHEKNGRRVIVPGDPDASKLIRLVESDDPDERMPQDPDNTDHA